jgi:hypothetical protein
MIECNLCNWITSEDNVHGIKRHEDWHKFARIQKRNTTNGIVVWRSKGLKAQALERGRLE